MEKKEVLNDIFGVQSIIHDLLTCYCSIIQAFQSKQYLNEFYSLFYNNEINVTIVA